MVPPSQRKPAPRGLSTTKAGTWLKHQIPIRTFADWEDAQPGFLEADLVAHCGGHTQGSYLYTLTLTDVATGWTECLPLLARTSDLVLAALEPHPAWLLRPRGPRFCQSHFRAGQSHITTKARKSKLMTIARRRVVRIVS